MMYRYYVSECLLPNGKVTNGGNLHGVRLPAERIEKLLGQAVAKLIEPMHPEAAFDCVARVVATPTQLQVTIQADPCASQNLPSDMLLRRVQQQLDPHANCDGSQLTFALEIPAGRKGKTVAPGVYRSSDSADCASVGQLLRTAHRKLAELNASPLELSHHARMRAPTDAWTRQRLGIGLLAPDIQKAMLQGTLSGAIDTDAFVGMELPLDWDEQRRALGMAR